MLPLQGRQRVERAAALYRAGISTTVILSGRSGLMIDQGDRPTEAAAMASYARELGIPAESLLLEEESRDTIGNAYFVARRLLEPNRWTAIRVVTSDFHVTRTAWVFQKILGSEYDVAFSPASTVLDATVIAARARAEGDITTFLMEWIGPIADGDRAAVERFIHEEHPAYASTASMTRSYIQQRVDEIARVHRVVDAHGLRGHRSRQERQGEL